MTGDGSIVIRVGPPPWVVGVLEQVAEDPLEPHPVDQRLALGAAVDLDRQIAVAVALGDPVAQVDEVDLLGVEIGRAGVEARELEQVDHHRVEASHLADHDVERLLAAVGQIVAAGVEHLDRRRQGGDRRAQLVADVGGEALLAFDPLLHGVGHVVERAGEPIEVGIGLLLEPRVEPTVGDVAGGVGDPRQRSQQPTAGRPPEERRQQRRQDRPDDQRRGQQPQRALGRVERERLEVPGVVGVDGDARRRATGCRRRR